MHEGRSLWPLHCSARSLGLRVAQHPVDDFHFSMLMPCQDRPDIIAPASWEVGVDARYLLPVIYTDIETNGADHDSMSLSPVVSSFEFQLSTNSPARLLELIAQPFSKSETTRF